MKPVILMRQIHEHGTEWICTVGGRLSSGEPDVREYCYDPEVFRSIMRQALFDYVKTVQPLDGLPDYRIPLHNTSEDL